jgi:hypothetical protein
MGKFVEISENLIIFLRFEMAARSFSSFRDLVRTDFASNSNETLINKENFNKKTSAKI